MIISLFRKIKMNDPTYWFQDYAGGVQNLDSLDININYLTRTLFKIPRYNCQGIVDYSVGEHSLLVHDLLALKGGVEYAPLCLAALLHDAHEAYTGMGDVSSTTKRWFLEQKGWDLHVLERLVDAQIAATFGFDANLLGDPRIKTADRQARAYEVPRLFRNPSSLWGELSDPDDIDWMVLNSSRFQRLLTNYLT